MAKMQVYLPAELYERVKARGDAFNVSSVLQRALEESLAELDRREALDEAIRRHEAKHGRIAAREAPRKKPRIGRPFVARGSARVGTGRRRREAHAVRCRRPHRAGSRRPLEVEEARRRASGRDATRHARGGRGTGVAWRAAGAVGASLRAVRISPLDASMGRTIGELLATSRMSDVVDATLVLLSAAGDRIYTSDRDDLLALARAAERDVEIVQV